MAAVDTYPFGDDAAEQARQLALAQFEGADAIRNKQLDLYNELDPVDPLFSLRGPDERVRIEAGQVVSREFELPPLEADAEERQIPYILAFQTPDSDIAVFFDHETGAVSSTLVDHSLRSEDLWPGGKDRLSDEPIMGEVETLHIIGMLQGLYSAIDRVGYSRAPGANLYYMQEEAIDGYCERVNDELEAVTDALDDPDYTFVPLSDETRDIFVGIVRELSFRAPAVTDLRTRPVSTVDVLPTHSIQFSQFEDDTTSDTVIIERSSPETDRDSDDFGKHDCLVLDSMYSPKLFTGRFRELGDKRLEDTEHLRQTVLQFVGILKPTTPEAEHARQQALARLHQKVYDEQFTFSDTPLFRRLVIRALATDDYDATDTQVRNIVSGLLN